jgi:hypothetical protein
MFIREITKEDPKGFCFVKVIIPSRTTLFRYFGNAPSMMTSQKLHIYIHITRMTVKTFCIGFQKRSSEEYFRFQQSMSAIVLILPFGTTVQ